MTCYDVFQQDKIGDKLLSLRDPPKNLYVIGNTNLLYSTNILGIVGSRNISVYGERVLKMLFEKLRLYEFITVSGFMTGVDYMCHKLSLDFDIPTVAMLPCGISCNYPYVHSSTKDAIVTKGGLVCSEYPDFYPAKKWTFVNRNRLIAGLCDALLVIEAGVNSGSLITARMALSYDTPVLVIPGDIFREQSEGIYQLLKEGAKLVTTAQEIIDCLCLSLKFTCDSVFMPDSLLNQNNIVSSSLSVAVLKVLEGSGALNIENLASKLNISTYELNTELAFLEIEGVVTQKGGYFYVCKS